MKSIRKYVGKGAMLLLSLMLAVGAVPEMIPFADNVTQVEAAAEMAVKHVKSPTELRTALASEADTRIILDSSMTLETAQAKRTGKEYYVNGNKILDLNGKTIHVQRKKDVLNSYLFRLEANCNLTVIDSGKGGEVIMDADDTLDKGKPRIGYVIFFAPSGNNTTLEINGGTFKCAYVYNKFWDLAQDYKDPDKDENIGEFDLMSYPNILSGILVYNGWYKTKVYINGGTFENASQSSTLQEYPFLRDIFGEEENEATSFFLAYDNRPMEVHIYDGSFTSKNGASIANDNVDLTIHGGKFKFDYYNKVISNTTSVETWHGKLPEFYIGYDWQYMIIHDGRIGKLPSADQIAFADGVAVDMKFKGETFAPMSASQYENLSNNANNHYRDSVTFEVIPKSVTDADPSFTIAGEEADISGNSIRNSLIYLPGKQMKLHWQLTDYFNSGEALLDTTGVEHTLNPVVWLTELNPEGLPDNTARCFLTDGCIDLDALSNSKWADGENNISFRPGYTYFFSFSGTESYKGKNEYVIDHKPSMDRVYFKVPLEMKSIDSVKVYMLNADYAGTNTILPDVNKSIYSVEFASQTQDVEVVDTRVSNPYDTDVLCPSLKLRHTVVLQAKDGNRFTNDTTYKIPGVEDITAVINPFGNQVSLSFDIITACDHSSRDYSSYTQVDTLYHTCDTCGKKLVHTYTDWTQSSTKFTRTCTLCGQRDTSPLGGTITNLTVSPSDYLSGVAVGQPITIPQDIQVKYGAKEYAPSFQATELKWYRYEDIEYPTYVDTAKLIEVKDGETFLHERYLLKYKFTLPNVSDSGFTSATLVGFGARNNSITETAGRRIQLENIFTFGENRITGYRTISGYLIVEPIEYLTGSFTIPKISVGDTLSTLMNETWKIDGKSTLQNWNVTDLQTGMSITVTEKDGSQYGNLVGLASYDPAEDPTVSVLYDCTFEAGKVYTVVFGINAPNINTYGATKIYDYSAIPNSNANYTDYEMNRTDSTVTITATYEPLAVNALKVVEFTADEPAYGKTINPAVQGVAGLASFTAEVEKIDPKTGEVLVSAADLQGKKYEHGTYLLRVKMNTTGGQWQLPELRPENAAINGEAVDLYDRQWLTPTSGGAKGKYYFVFEKAYTIDHSWVIDSETKAMCEMDAVAKYHCVYCGETGEAIVAKRLGHTDLRSLKKQPAYCNQVGFKVDCYICPHCGKAFTDKDGKVSAGDVWNAINPDSHNPAHVTYEFDKDSHWTVCGDCGEVLSEAAEHVWEDEYYYDEEEEEEVYLGVRCSDCGLYADKEFSVEVIGGKVLDRYGDYVSQTNYPNCGGYPLKLIPDVAEDEIFLGWESTTEIYVFYPDACHVFLISRDCPVTITAKTKKSPCGSEHSYSVAYDSTNNLYRYSCRNCEKVVIEPGQAYWFDGSDYIDFRSIHHTVARNICTEIYLDIPAEYLEDAVMEVYKPSGDQIIPLNSLSKEVLNGDEHYKLMIESPVKDWNSKISIMIRDAEKHLLMMNSGGSHFTLFHIVPADAYKSIGLTGQPEDVTVSSGSTAAFKVTTTVEGLTYQWQYKTATTDWAAVPGGGKLAAYSFTANMNQNGNLYRCVITDKDGKAYISVEALLTVKEGSFASPVISSLSSNATGVQVTWGAVTGASQYRVFYKTATGAWTTVRNVKDTSTTVAGLKSGTTYSFLVRCLSADGKFYTDTYDAAKSKSITYIAQPAVSSVSNTANGVQVKWNAVGGAAQYRVFYKAEGGAWTGFGNTKETSMVVTGLTAGTTYSFTVRCISADGKAYTSTYDTTGKSIVYQPADTMLAKPEITALNSNASGVQVTWGAVAGAAQYRVFYKTATGAWTTFANVKGTGTTVTGLTSGTTYTFLVRCLSEDGKAYTSDYDATKSKSITYIAQPAVSSLSNVANGVEVKWNAVGGAAQYRVFYKAAGGAWTGFNNTTGTSMVVTGLTAGTTYSFTVRCVSADGKSYTSTYDTTGKSIVYQPAAGTMLAKPEITALSSNSAGVQVTWGAVAGAAQYRVFYKTATGAWTTFGNTTGTSLTVTGLTSGTTYTFLVRCLSADGKAYTSDYDAAMSKSLTYIAQPAVSSVTNTSTGVQVKWNAVPGAAQYRVFYKPAGGAWTGYSNTTGTGMVVTGLTKGTTYSFTVRCLSADGKSYTSTYDTTGKSIKYE